jgi:hypothetical protein
MNGNYIERISQEDQRYKKSEGGILEVGQFLPTEEQQCKTANEQQFGRSDE